MKKRESFHVIIGDKEHRPAVVKMLKQIYGNSFKGFIESDPNFVTIVQKIAKASKEKVRQYVYLLFCGDGSRNGQTNKFLQYIDAIMHTQCGMFADEISGKNYLQYILIDNELAQENWKNTLSCNYDAESLKTILDFTNNSNVINIGCDDSIIGRFSDFEENNRIVPMKLKDVKKMFENYNIRLSIPAMIIAHTKELQIENQELFNKISKYPTTIGGCQVFIISLDKTSKNPYKNSYGTTRFFNANKIEEQIDKFKSEEAKAMFNNFGYGG